MKLFLTGGTGFIGSHVLVAALASGHQVCALRRTPQSRPVISLPCEPEWITGNLHTLQPNQIAGADAVIHLATSGVSPKRVSWNELLEANVVGSLRVIEIGALAGVCRFVVAGSSHEYGQAASRFSPIPPYAPLEPVNPYGASKAAAFHLLRAFAIEQKLELFYGRIFSAYGEGQFVGNFWPSLKRAALGGEDFPMTSGRQICDFIPVAEAAAHLLQACSRADIAPGAPLVVNIGSGTATSLLAFAEAQWHSLKAKGELIPASLPDRSDQIERYVPDLQGLKISTAIS